MDSNRFDSLICALASGASRRSVLKGVLGLGGAAAIGGTIVRESDARLAGTRPTLPPPPPPAPTPTPTPTPADPCPGQVNCVVDGCCEGDCTAGGRCCPTGRAVCGEDCCDDLDQCCDGECCPAGSFCLTRKYPESSGAQEEVCCSLANECPFDPVPCCADGSECCSIDGCCDGACFDPESIGPHGNGDPLCCPAGSVFCVSAAGTRCCPPGSACDGQGNCCVVGTVCESDRVCCTSGCNSLGECCDPNGTPCGDVCCTGREVCLPDPRCCTPVTCSANACGPYHDGCGGIVECGTCDGAGEECLLGQCCVPDPEEVVCAGQCGRRINNCSQIFDCDDCPEGQVCIAIDDRCCTPVTCSENHCGEFHDGCGGIVDCGPCTGEGEECHGGACCVPTPDAQVCEGHCLRAIDPACGRLVLCPDCPEGQICLDELVCCQPATCEQRYPDCGFLDPGCGLPLIRCDCPEGETCSGGVCTDT